MNPPKNPQPEQYNFRELAECIADEMFQVLARADWILLRAAEALDADDESLIESMSEEENLARIRSLQDAHWDGIPREASSIGQPQTAADLFAHRDIKEVLERLVPGSKVAGEEATPQEWDEAMASRIAWVVDAIDGSSLHDTVGYGYGTTAILYFDGFPMLMVSVNDSGRMVAWISAGREPAKVMAGLLRSPRSVTEIDAPIHPVESLDPDRGSTVAVVAALPKHRDQVMGILTRSRWTVMTLGGAPAMSGLLLGRLAAVVVPKPQTRHDAAPLLALNEGMGLHFLDLSSGRRIPHEELQSYFWGVQRPQIGAENNPDYLSIPAMVIARDGRVAQEIVKDIRRGHLRSAFGEG